MILKALQASETLVVLARHRSPLRWLTIVVPAWVAVLLSLWVVAWFRLGPAPPGEQPMLAGLATAAVVKLSMFDASGVLAPWRWAWAIAIVMGISVMLVSATARRLREKIALLRAALTPGVRAVVGEGEFASHALEALGDGAPVLPLSFERLLAAPAHDNAIRVKAYSNVQTLYLISPVTERNYQAARAVARDQATRWSRTERLFVRAESRSLRANTSRWLTGRTLSGTVRSEFVFSVTSTLARQTLRARPLQRLVPVGEGPPTVVLLGDADLLFEALVYTARTSPSLIGTPRFVVACAAPSELIATIEHLAPDLGKFLFVEGINADPYLPESAPLLLERITLNHKAPLAWVLACRTPGLARRWREQTISACIEAGFHAPVFEDFSEATASRALDQGIGQNDVAVLTEDDHFAQLSHESYRAELRALAEQLGPRPADRPWEELSFDFQEQNRAQVDHWWAKARDLNCLIQEVAGSHSAEPSEDLLDALAEVEHVRWCISRAIAGWVYSPSRDDEKRRHPMLVPWADLDAAERSLDASRVAGLRSVLATQGLGLQGLAHHVEGIGATNPHGGGLIAASLKTIQQRGDLVEARRLSDTGHPVSLLFLTPHGSWANPQNPADQDLLEWAATRPFRLFFNFGRPPERAVSMAIDSLKPGVSGK